MAFSLDELTEDIAGGRKGKGMNKGKLIIVGVILIGVYVLVFKEERPAHRSRNDPRHRISRLPADEPCRSK